VCLEFFTGMGCSGYVEASTGCVCGDLRRSRWAGARLDDITGCMGAGIWAWAVWCTGAASALSGVGYGVGGDILVRAGAEAAQLDDITGCGGVGDWGTGGARLSCGGCLGSSWTAAWWSGSCIWSWLVWLVVQSASGSSARITLSTN
jgi:hypothetical protein